MKQTLFVLLCFCFVTAAFAGKVVPLPDITKPKTITVIDNQVFITENIRVTIYSAKDFKKITAFGKRGEGPREFKIMDNAEIGIGVQVSVQPDYILVNSIGKISYFSRTGEYLREVNTHLARGPYGHNFTPIDKQFAAYGFYYENKVGYVAINIYSPKLEKTKELYRHPFFVQQGKKTNLEIWRPSLFFVSKGRIVIDRQDGIIDILNFAGEKIGSIAPQYPKVKVTSARQKRYLDFLKKDPRFRDDFDFIKKTGYFPEYLPLIRTFTVDDKKIYVLTNREKEDKREFYILDYKGKLLIKAWMPIADKTPIEPYPFAIRDGILYQLKENLDTEEWELHIEKL